MSIGEVRPTTLSGVKSFAAQIRKTQGIKHSVALDIAARAAGCSNFTNARRILPERSCSYSHSYILLTQYWYDKENRYKVGRETLRVELSRPILDICGKRALKNVRGFGDLRMVAPDHFVCDTLGDNQSYARARLCTAERSLRFMEATGLRPSRDYRKAFPNGDSSNKLPGADHSTDWVDPVTDQFILVDEPYGGVNEAKRFAWASRHGWLLRKTSWPGMYNPYHCDLWVATDGRSGYDIDSLVTAIENMGAPSLPENWRGASAESWETFTSPQATTPQDVRRARCRGTIFPCPSRATVPYSYRLGCSSRRPDGKLGIEGHILAGRMIKAVLWSSERPWGVWKRMNSLRSTLEDWLALEIGRGELEGPEFFDVYYHDLDEEDDFKRLAASRAGLVTLLTDLRGRLLAAYPNCEPLRRQLQRIDMSIRMVQRTKAGTN